MSRTIKRKNIEKKIQHYVGSNPFGGFKIAGVYTEADSIDYGAYSYREPTAEERFDTWKYFHSERPSHRFEGISKDERKIEEKKHRQRERLKITRYKHGASEDVVSNKNPKIFPPWWW